MTTQFPNIEEPSLVLDPPQSSHLRLWLLLAAVGLGAGAAVAVIAGQGGVPDPVPGDTLAGLAAGAQQDDLDDDELLEGPSIEKENRNAPPVVEEDDDGAVERAAPIASTKDTGFFVQVASHKKAADAADHVAALAAQGIQASAAAPPGSGDGSWHRVRLGPFATRAEAEKARFGLKVNGRKAAYVEPRSNGKYHVQVGSFATREEAEPIARRLADQGHVTKISRIKMGDRRWHCVRIGPFDTAEEAAGYKDLVKDVPGGEPVVIPYGPPK